MHPALTWALQRLVVAPLVVALTVLMWTTLPLTLVVTGAMSGLVPGWLRPVRLLWLAILHLTLESILLVELFGLWIGSGFGLFVRRPYFERIHYDLMQTYLVVFFREARRVLRLKIETVGPAPDAMPGEPLLVLCRHAGVGDSFSIMYALMHWYHREPRIVLKSTLAWDPALGVMLTRLPSRFVSAARGHDVIAEIGDLARNLDHNDAFVIFPEGGNFTANRRRRAIARLRRIGRHTMADQAEDMHHVLAPQPGGVLAALDAAPEADVLLVAHTGLDHLDTVANIWRELPMDKQLLMGWWRVPRSEIPDGREFRIEWLFERWRQIDAWVAEHRPVDLPRKRATRRTSVG
ncbi:1-acyl-sn-glycerol-3-phosphate acyltransferase [Nocardioides pocheonensis]|uniref:1-acyl-sn-glycerol-3-phosphate acyltransferase n=1 Tax=Nocardioides pocheonensis TaxID=661485 RepID=A0A3N0GJI2_9ACTN|nr:1-acyl-sn-glycerol-3-phosphate acyltransferase [Nocardioides pocheonensis]RNM12613.1 1-acyl-sn-glycerol-3-phosphate acyltransferase [Nocardioides pocheonensis]